MRVWFDADDAVVRAVDCADFHVDDGEALGIVGESGCGKTVMALSLVGLLPDTAKQIQSGSSVRFRGRELVGAGENELRRLRGAEIAMVFQDPSASLNPVLSVGEQIDEVARLHLALGREEARAETIRLLGEVGLPGAGELVDDPPHELSGGMRQRVAIAMALAGNPSLLVADEPTTSLDVTIQAQILDLLGELRRRRGMALLLVSHDLAVVSQVCERVAGMYAGQMVETGPVAQVFADPRHPYTRALLRSREDSGDGRFHVIPGTVPTPSEPPSGCRFSPRCDLSFARCASEPEEEWVGPDRSARCWLSGGVLPGDVGSGS